MEQFSDEQLVVLIQEGKAEAFEQLFWRYKDRIIAAINAIVRNRQDALELTQECFTRIYQNIHKYQPGTKFFTWAYRIAYNLSIDRCRRRATSKEVKLEQEMQSSYLPDEDSVAPSLGINPERVYARAELRAHLNAAMSSLSEKHRSVIVLREVEGLSYAEIAEALDIQIGTVMSRLYHARSKLQSALKSYVDDELPKA